MKLRIAALVCLVFAAPALADEGMFTFNDFPSADVKQKYGFEPTQAWLDQVRLGSVRIAGGCSASLVSADGLVMTNHHCARACIENLSGLQKKDFNRDGYFARTIADEQNCPGMELNQLVEITNVTQRVQDATRAVAADRFAEAQRTEIAKLERACATSDDFRCDVVTLYRGGRYELYKYRRFRDVRLVLAPEDAIAFFGGDPDNFMFPRYDLDLAFVRLYGADGKPFKTDASFTWSASGAKDGELTFVSGNPGGTSRTLTAAQLEDDRDFRLPLRLARLEALRGVLAEYQTRGAEQKRHSNDFMFGVENAFKALTGRHNALDDQAFFGKLKASEADFRKKVNANPQLKKAYGGTWDEIAALVKKTQGLRKEYQALEGGPSSDLFSIARTLVRYAAESSKPNGERLREFTDARLPQLKASLLSRAPISKELEIVRLAWSLAAMRDDLGPDHAVVKRILGRKAPAEVARSLVEGTRLDQLVAAAPDTTSRTALFNLGRDAVDASADPMIVFARSFDPEARAIRARFETEIDGPLKQQQELLARARFAVYRTNLYPDATFTLRLSYGSVKGYEEGGRQVKPFTTIGGAFAKHTGVDPYALPKSWLKARDRLSADTPFNFVTTNDIIGGNSGSPVINQAREVVGLIFDGNMQSLGGDYGFDEAQNRAVAVHSSAILEALEKVYGAQRIVDELRGSGAQSAPALTAAEAVSGVMAGEAPTAMGTASPAPTASPTPTASPAPTASPSPTAPGADAEVDTAPVTRMRDDDAYAVVIGIEGYRGELPPAEHAEHDAAVFARYLVRTLGVPSDHVKVLLGQRASKSDIEAALDEWLPATKARPGARVYFYYSGHGAPDPTTGDSYLVPWDGDPAFPKTKQLRISEVYSKLTALKGRRVLAFLDACFSGAGARSVLPKGVRPLVVMKPVELPKGLFASLSASEAAQTSGASASSRHGLFTEQLLRGLSGLADRDGDHVVSLHELNVFVGRQVRDLARAQGREQSPTLSFSGVRAAGEWTVVDGLVE